MALAVVQPGLQSLLQDAGRPGYARIGVGRSGALDQAALNIANRTVGNRPNAAAIEILVGRAEFRSQSDLEVAYAGAMGEVTIDQEPVPAGLALELPRGSVLRFGPAMRGARYYLAVAGGLLGRQTLGSVSWDGLAGLGHPPLAAGEVLSIGDAAVLTQNYRLPNPLAAASVGQPLCQITAGPRQDWLAGDGWHQLVTTKWQVGADSNRTALRLTGPRLEVARSAQLPSEGVLPGAVQLPPDGQPVVFLADHPVTGGYPIVGVVRAESLSMLGQLLPGDPVRFNG